MTPASTQDSNTGLAGSATTNGQSQQTSNSYVREIEVKERELRASILANYARIKGVEKELAGLTLQLQMNVGPRKHALEMLRNKIEQSNERVSEARHAYVAGKKQLQTLEEALQIEETAKARLCSELELLVSQSTSAQLAKLQELNDQLTQMHLGVGGEAHPVHAASISAAHAKLHANGVAPGHASRASAPQGPADAQGPAEAPASTTSSQGSTGTTASPQVASAPVVLQPRADPKARLKAEAAAALARNVAQIESQGDALGGGGAMSASNSVLARQTAAVVNRQATPQTVTHGRGQGRGFAGFDDADSD